MANVSLAFDILARDKASRTLKHVGDTADKSGRQISDMGGTLRGAGSKLGGFAKAAGIAAVGVGGLAIVVGKGLIDAATESQKVTKQTEAVLKSMGPSAGVTAKHVAGLSKRLSEQAGVDDELIQSGQNVLLTFGKIQNKAGKGNKVFDRATKAALNMSVALGTDLSAANIQVGKALNDPIKGITALSRAGVSFSSKQKETIKKLVETGDTLGAQKIILGELEKQFGGSAAAQATAGDRLKVIWGNLQEDLGMKLLPMFEKVATWLSKNLPGALDTLGRWLAPLADQIGLFWGALTTGFTEDEGTPIESVALGIRDAAAAVNQWFVDNGETLKTLVGNVFGAIKTIFDDLKGVAEDVGPAVLRFGQWFIDNGPAAEIAVAGLAAALVAYAVAAAQAAFASLAAAWPLLAFALAVGGLTWATNALIEKFNLMPAASNVFQAAMDTVGGPLLDFIAKLAEAVGLLEELHALMDFLPGALGISEGDPNDPQHQAIIEGAQERERGRARARGGPVLPGMRYLVGEKGPELLTMGATGGFVTPNDLLERLPTHKAGAVGGGDLHLHVTQAPGENQVDAGMRALRHHRQVRLEVGA